MMKLRRIGIGVSVVLLTVVAGFFVLLQIRVDRTFDVPEPKLRASGDSAMIERGRYLAFGPAHCASCHAPGALVQAAFGAQSIEEYRHIMGGLDSVPLSGGFSYTFEMGTLHFPNITPDAETGIGRFTDGQLARVLRHGVRPDGRALLPIMEYQNLSDEDVVALLSFLRAQRPIGDLARPMSLSPSATDTMDRS